MSNLAGRPVILDGELAAAHRTHKAPVPMEMVPMVGLSFSGDPELESRPTYAEVVVGLQAIGQ